MAVALRMLPMADGSDMMGSLRNPAAFNNIDGFRLTWGRVPARPAPEMFLGQLSTEGPMARNVADLAQLSTKWYRPSCSTGCGMRGARCATGSSRGATVTSTATEAGAR